MSNISFSRSLALPVSAHKVVKIQALSRSVAATEQRATVQLPVEIATDGEYIAAKKPEYAAGSVRSLNNQMAVIDKQLSFYQQHQSLEVKSSSSLGVNIDCLL